MDFHSKNILVCGMAQSGIAAARLLKTMGAKVTIQDLKDLDKLDISGFESEEIDIYAGKNPDDIIQYQHLIILSPGIPCDLPFIEKARELNIPVWGEIELAYRLCPCKIVAITGTNGKTTTTALVGEIFKLYNNTTEVVGNIGIPFTSKVAKLKSEDFVVAEVSSFQLETTHEFQPKVSAVLNIQADHLNRHKTLENYQAIKERIFKNQDADCYCVLNYDDEACLNMKERTEATVLFFSRQSELEDCKSGVFLKDDYICIKTPSLTANVVNVKDLQIFGKHNIENALAAVAISICAGLDLKLIQEGLLNFKGVEHRMEFVRRLNGATFYNDSKATNPDSAIKALEAIEAPIILIGGGYDKDLNFSDWVKLFSKKVKHFIVLGQVSDKIIEICKAYSYTQYDKVNSLRDAVELAYSKSVPQDVILLSPACASWDMFDNFEQRGQMFKKFVRELG